MTTLLVLALLGLLSQSPPAGPPARVGGDVKAPRKVRSVNPEYPADARRAGLAGVVILECTLDPRGEVADVVVLRGVPPLTEAASKAVRQWRYEPTLLDGVPVPVIMTVTVNFKMERRATIALLGSLDHRKRAHPGGRRSTSAGLRRAGGISRGDIEKAIRALEPLAEKDESPPCAPPRLGPSRGSTGGPCRRGGPPRARPVRPVGARPPPAPRRGARSSIPCGQCDVTRSADLVEIRVPSGAYDLSIELGQVTAPRLMQARRRRRRGPGHGE